MLDYLQREDIIFINQSTLKVHGGNYVPPENLLHGEALEYLVETVQAEMFGEPLYPTLADKAALYLFNVVSNHIFQDGNKRTGLEAAKLFLRLNGSNFKADLQPIKVEEKLIPASGESRDDHLINFTLEVASGTVPLAACQQWFAQNITPQV
ncbi:type II toxin-antitoxin system death-on-curing family toxin [Neolewinella sp.]|uniref:type II toxin-antitoxin system death-on-curing family toxin n=1 Tax=Neolewinella sp. TaxID=2993543 RepID=UPI003B527138